MKTVLGLSLTSTSVGWVLLDSDDPDAPALDHDAFDVLSEVAADGDIDRHLAAVRGAQAIATSSGHEVRTIGVTWTDDAEAKGSLLLKALPDLGFDDVKAVLLPHATRAWAKALSTQQEFEQCAVCVLEPAAMTVLAVHTGFGTVRTSVTHVRENADGVARWLTDVFDRNGWRPEDLYLVGARGDLELTSGSVEDALPMPVVWSDEAQLSLARGAALSVPLHTEVDDAAEDAVVAAAPVQVVARRRRRIGPHARAGAALVAGVIALFAVGPELAGQNRTRPAEERPPADSSASVTSATSATAVTPAAAQTPRTAPPAAVESAPLAVAPAPEPPTPPASVVAEAPPVDEQVAATPVVAPVPSAATPEAAPVEVPSEPLVVSEPVAPAEAAPVAPVSVPPAPVAPPPLVPQPGPPPGAAAPPPPPDPVQMVLSPFFGALP